jgi:hypothetical protein
MLLDLTEMLLDEFYFMRGGCVRLFADTFWLMAGSGRGFNVS